MSRIDGRDISKKQWMSVFANPIWMKCARSRLRLKHVLSWGLITVSITAFACLLVYFVSIEEGVAETDAARAMMIPIVIIQGGLMMLLGTGSVSSAISQEREDRLLDYQRMTPMSPRAKIMALVLMWTGVWISSVALTGKGPLIVIGLALIGTTVVLFFVRTHRSEEP